MMTNEDGWTTVVARRSKDVFIPVRRNSAQEKYGFVTFEAVQDVRRFERGDKKDSSIGIGVQEEAKEKSKDPRKKEGFKHPNKEWKEEASKSEERLNKADKRKSNTKNYGVRNSQKTPIVWSLSVMETRRWTWVRCQGISMHGWSERFFQFLAGKMGTFINYGFEDDTESEARHSQSTCGVEEWEGGVKRSLRVKKMKVEGKNSQMDNLEWALMDCEANEAHDQHDHVQLTVEELNDNVHREVNMQLIRSRSSSPCGKINPQRKKSNTLVV
ncbi:hypothetical protein VNO78_05907 [Psophocarpus tetragonolobus]|uniref:Uncharacterized protein n=1 Tax=Psophocarpus tetragonolobus TaxID=3891 RepID=A0AAN9SRH9_PSOTE